MTPLPDYRDLHRERFNDGYMTYGYTTTQRSGSGKRMGSDFQDEGKLAFRLLNHRDQDYELASTMGSQLDLKVKCLLPPPVKSNRVDQTLPTLFSNGMKNLRKSKIKVRIDRVIYDVITVDFDSNRRYIFFYLQEVGGFVE